MRLGEQFLIAKIRRTYDFYLFYRTVKSMNLRENQQSGDKKYFSYPFEESFFQV